MKLLLCFVNNFKDSDAKCTAAIADQQTKPIFNAPFKPKQWPRRGSRQFGDIFLHTKVGMSAIYSLTTKPQATDFFRQFVYLLTEQKPGTKTFWFYKGILLFFFKFFFLKNVVVTLDLVNVQLWQCKIETIKPFFNYYYILEPILKVR